MALWTIIFYTQLKIQFFAKKRGGGECSKTKHKYLRISFDLIPNNYLRIRNRTGLTWFLCDSTFFYSPFNLIEERIPLNSLCNRNVCIVLFFSTTNILISQRFGLIEIHSLHLGKQESQDYKTNFVFLISPMFSFLV